jgi:hypothetical protein
MNDETDLPAESKYSKVKQHLLLCYNPLQLRDIQNTNNPPIASYRPLTQRLTNLNITSTNIYTLFGILHLENRCIEIFG